MKKIMYYSVALVLFITLACSFGGLLPGGGSVPPELQYIFEIPDNPLGVTPTLNGDDQAEAVIPVAGGTLSVTGSDGTVFRLDIPSGALVTDTLVRMIPVGQIEGMPFGSEQFAVQFEPEGLQLYANAILTITPLQEIPVDQQIFFGYQRLGENLVLVPPVMDSREIKIVVMHFSGAGVAKGLLADIESVRARIGGDAESRIRSAFAEKLQQERQRQLLGQADGEPIDWEGFFKQYEEQVVKPRVAAAGESCAAGRLALQTLLGFERQKQLLGMAGENSGFIDQGVMDTVAETCMKEEYEMCRDNHIIHRVIPAWLGLSRQYQLLGVEGGASAPVLEKAKEYVRKCLTFELRFESQGTFDDGGDGYTSSVDSKIKIQFNPGDFNMKGQAPLVNNAFEFRVSDCSVESMRGGDTFEVIQLGYVSDTKSPTDELGYVRDFELIYYPGNTKESFTVTCEDNPPYTAPPTPLWTGIFLVSHESEMSQAAGGFIAEDWEILGGEYFAKKEWIIETAEDTVEAGTLKLYHKPE